MEEVLYSLSEHSGDILISASFLSYFIALLHLTAYGSPIFVIGSYLGTFLLMCGLVTKFGVLRSKIISKDGFAVMLLFSSAFLFTTAANVMFIDVAEKYSIVQMTSHWISLRAMLKATIFHPYAWLLPTLIGLGAIFLLIACVILYFS